MPGVIIIGAGLAGLSLACELVDEGYEVLILEKESHLGGRASNTIDEKTGDAVPIGPHIFLASYNNFRRFLQKIGAEESIFYDRRVFTEFVYDRKRYEYLIADIPGGMLTMYRMMRYPFTKWYDQLSNLRLAAAILFSPDERFEKLDDITALDYLRSQGVTTRCIDMYWRMFVMSFLNIPIERCSAAEFCLLLKFWTKQSDRCVGLGTKGLGDIYTGKAEAYITSRGGKILRNAAVMSVACRDGKVEHLVVQQGGKERKIRADLYVSTLPPPELVRGVPPELERHFGGLRNLQGVPYITVNIWFDRKITDKKFWALVTDGNQRYMNTDFYDQSNLYTGKPTSFITSNIIYSHAYHAMTDDKIVARTVEEIREAFPDMQAKVVHSVVHRLPYVIYAPYPGMRQHKLSQETPIPNLFLAGDWTIREHPQSMEAAVRSGFKCAERILTSRGKDKSLCDDRIL